jgi:hypothetical protein
MEKVNASEMWLDHAKHYNEIYHKGLSREYIVAHRVYASALGNMLRNLPPDLPIRSDVRISSIVLVEFLIKQSYGSQYLTIDVIFVSIEVEMLAHQAVCFMWTFKDQLNFSVVYDGAYDEKKQTQILVKAVKKFLITALGQL